MINSLFDQPGHRNGRKGLHSLQGVERVLNDRFAEDELFAPVGTRLFERGNRNIYVPFWQVARLEPVFPSMPGHLGQRFLPTEQVAFGLVPKSQGDCTVFGGLVFLIGLQRPCLCVI